MSFTPPPFPKPITVESAQAWVQACAPRDGDRIDETFMRLGACFVIVLGASMDLMLEMRRKVDLLDEILRRHE